MSDTEASPAKDRHREPLNLDDYNLPDKEPKCINSLCSLIHTRLKYLENEIVAQHKVWESIQKEVDEVKSLIEESTSTCGSSSSNGQENESENVDSALESHKTCNSFLWGKIRQAEESVEKKKSLMRILSSDVTQLKNSKRKCSRKFSKSKSNVDLILDVTNALHALKCDNCKFCRDHLDFREGFLSSVIELIHFTEKNHSSSLEENKVLKTCLQKIYSKTKNCLLHSQIYMKNNQHNHSFDNDSSSICVDNIYTSFEEFCRHFQNLQEELLQLRQILLAAEENQLDDIFQNSHLSNCICYNFDKKGESNSSNASVKNEMKLSKEDQKHLGSFEKKLKTLTYEDETDDAHPMFESEQMFRFRENDVSKQLELLRSRISEAVHSIRDVEVEDNDDENLVSMVTSLSEECRALRQEVSYLRNVRQEKKRSWNKLQCFIMDAERKLKGKRSAFHLKEIMKDLNEIIASSDSSLGETILYMYSNQLEWVESLVNSSEANTECFESDLAAKPVTKSISIQTSLPENISEEFRMKQTGMCDIAVQAINDFDYFESKSDFPYQTSFSEINREIYVVPELVEESDSCYASLNCKTKDNESSATSNTESKEDLESEVCELTESLSQDDENITESNNQCTDVVPKWESSGSFSEALVPLKFSNKFTLPLINIADASFNVHKSLFDDIFFNRNLNKCYSNSNLYVYFFLNCKATRIIEHAFFSLLNKNFKSIEISDEEKNWKCVVLESNLNDPIVRLSGRSLRSLSYPQDAEEGTSISEFQVNEVPDPEIDGESVVTATHLHDLSSTPLCRGLLPNKNSDLENVHETAIVPAENSGTASPNSDDGFLNYSDDAERRSSLDSDLVQSNPAPACREGTFIVEPSESFHYSKVNTFNENLYCTAILTALVSSDSNASEKNYVLFEANQSKRQNTAADGSTSDPAHKVQHYVLCEAFHSEMKEQPEISDICHIIFCKSVTKEKNSFFDIPTADTVFDPLLPQYFPVENLNYESYEPLSLTHNCEIYMSKMKDNILYENDNLMLLPKNYLKFKTSLPSKNISGYIMDESLNENYLPNHCSNSFEIHKAVNIVPLESTNVLNSLDSPGLSDVGHNHMWSPANNLYNDSFSEKGNDSKNVLHWQNNCSSPEASKLEVPTRPIKGDVEEEKPAYLSNDQSANEKNLLDEIKALKENLNQQNVVLHRLKEELEDANLHLDEKEQEIQVLQSEHSRLNEALLRNNIKEIEDKLCQTDSSERYENHEDLKKELNLLREENNNHNEKIMHQNKTIQHVKSQLCASIDHLKSLKDSAVKQLKWQKHEILKSMKIKKQLQETKLALEKKCAELEKKNEMLSDQEFQIHELQTRYETAVEEFKEKSSQNVQSSVIIKVDTECQTDLVNVNPPKKRGETPLNEKDLLLQKHSEDLLEIQAKLQHLETIFTNKTDKSSSTPNSTKAHELKVPTHLKEGNIWKLLMISEQSYLSLLNKLADSLQLTDLKGATTLMHSSWLNCDELADARRQDHKKILQNLDKLKRSIRYLQESHHEQKRQSSGSEISEEKKSSFVCHTDEMHLQYLCEVLQRAQENLMKEYSQKKISQHRSSVTPASVRNNRLAVSRERKIPLELKNGKILALLDEKGSTQELLPNRYDINKIDTKAGTSSFKSRTSS